MLQGLGLKLQRTDPVALPASRVRAEISGIAEGAWRAGGSSALLNEVFRDSFADLFTATHEARWQRVLTPADLDDPSVLAHHVYQELAGPRLARQQAALQEFSQELLNFWEAVQALCGWFCGILRSALANNHIRYDEFTCYWINVDSLVRPERDLFWQVNDPAWSAPVRIEGRPGTALRMPGSEDWFVLETQLTGASAEADQAKACLHYGLLTAATAGTGSVSMLTFHPELRENRLAAAEAEPALKVLKPIIGRLAGVSFASGAPPPQPRVPEPAEPVATEDNVCHQAMYKVLASCRHLGANVHVVGRPAQASAFCRFVLEPAREIPPRKVDGLLLDMRVRMELSALPVLIRRGEQIWLDVQRKDRQPVLFSEIRDKILPGDSSSRVPVGLDPNGVLRSLDLSNPLHAHVLVAGCQGSGKTEWLRSAIAGLLVANSTETLRLALVDPKGTSFADLKDSPFLYRAEGLDTVTDTLDALIAEMEARQRMHQKAHVDDLRQYMDKTGEKRPRIVCVIDDYSLLAGAANRKSRREIDARIARLGARGRAAGIHMIAATGQINRDVIGGALQANMTCRVVLRTHNAIESRLLLGVSRAEGLLNNGDLLFQDIQEPVRLQAPFLTERDRQAIFAGVS